MLLIAQWQEAGPFKSSRIKFALRADVAVVGAIHRRLELGIKTHFGIKRGRKNHLVVDAEVIHITDSQVRFREIEAAGVAGRSAEVHENIARFISTLCTRTK